MGDDSAGTESEPVFRLVYRSHLRHPRTPAQGGARGDLQHGPLEEQAPGRHRGAADLGDNIVQALEGDEETVRDLYRTIHRDPRHERVAVLETVEATERVFGKWSMARVSDEDQPDIPLPMDRDKGGITPAARRPTTPEQDAVLDAMRDHVRGAQPA